MELIEAIKKRRSIRRFKRIPVPRKGIEEILNFARLAPSSANRQPWRFMMVEEPMTIKKLADTAPGHEWLTYAPIILACLGDGSVYEGKGLYSSFQPLADLGMVENVSYDDFDSFLSKASDREIELARTINCFLNVAIIIDHITLLALEYGLGTCWIRRFDASKVREILNIPRKYVIVALLSLGYPESQPPPKPRMEVEEILITKS